LAGVNNGEFFLIYPLNEHEYTLMLSKNNLVYLTANIRGPSLDIQKTINYSNLYFATPAKKLYVPDGKDIEILTTSKLERTSYNEAQISQTKGKPSNFPLPVLGELSASNSGNAVIIEEPVDNNSNPSPKSMESKKNLLPIVAVFIFTAALASVIIWFVLNRNNTDELQTPSNETAQTNETIPTSAPEPTAIPTPTISIVEPDKTIKIQILNATDINGQAATIKAKFTALGFKNVSVGNAKETATSNSIEMKSDLAESEGFFKSKPDTDFPATYSSDLKDSSTYDLVVTIGTDLSQSSATTLLNTTTSTAVTTTPAASKSATVTPTKKLTPTPEE
jgi:hypothetical protein